MTALVNIFVEDAGYRELVASVARRIAAEAKFDADFQILSSTGGSGRATSELAKLIKDIDGGSAKRPDVLIVGVDADGKSPRSIIREIEKTVSPHERTICLVVAVADPHVEKWYLMQPTALGTAMGIHVAPVPMDLRGKGIYKHHLANVSSDVGSVFGGTEYGPEIAEVLDLTPNQSGCPDFDMFLAAALRCLRD